MSPAWRFTLGVYSPEARRPGDACVILAGGQAVLADDGGVLGELFVHRMAEEDLFVTADAGADGILPVLKARLPETAELQDLSASLAVHAAAWMVWGRSFLPARYAPAPKLEISRVELSAGIDEEKPPGVEEERTERDVPVPRLPVPQAEIMPDIADTVEMKTAVSAARELDPPPVEVKMTPPPASASARVEAPARPVRAISPKYPRGARRRGEEGVVEVMATVGADGGVSSVEVVKSSGYGELDAAACDAVGKASFVPAQVNGENTVSVARVTLHFRLR